MKNTDLVTCQNENKITEQTIDLSGDCNDGYRRLEVILDVKNSNV